MLKKISIVLAGLLCTLHAGAQVTFSTVEDAWKYADEHSVPLLTAGYELEKARLSKKQAYSALLPQANGTGSFTDNIQRQTTLIPTDVFGGPPGSFKTLQFGQQYAYAGGVTAQWGVLNLQNWYGTQVAKLGEAISRDSIASVRKTLYQQIATQYYSYLLMQEAARLAALTGRVADSVQQSVSNKFAEGLVNEASLDMAKLNSERAAQNALSARYQMLIARNNLKGLLGMALTDSLSITATLVKEGNADAQGAFTQDPAIRLAELRSQVSLAQYRQANSAFAPSFNILYNYTTQRFDNKFEPFSNATGTAAWFPAQYWSVQATVPIFSAGNRLFQSRKLKLTYRETQMLLENTVKQSAINDENLRLSYQKAVGVLQHAEAVMNLSMDNYRHMSYRYEAGLESLDNRLLAFRDFIDYQNQYLNSLSDMLVQLYQVRIRQQTL